MNYKQEEEGDIICGRDTPRHPVCIDRSTTHRPSPHPAHQATTHSQLFQQNPQTRTQNTYTNDREFKVEQVYITCTCSGSAGSNRKFETLTHQNNLAACMVKQSYIDLVLLVTSVRWSPWPCVCAHVRMLVLARSACCMQGSLLF